MCYPFGLYFAEQYRQDILVAMSVVWGLNGLFSKEKSDKATAFLIASFFAINVMSNQAFLSYLYPVFVSLMMLVLFANSLKGEAFITKIARIKEPNMPSHIELYTRNLTKIWIAFFIFNTLVCTILALFEDKSYWVFYTGVFSYVLMGVIFGVEFVVRKFHKKRYENG